MAQSIDARVCPKCGGKHTPIAESYINPHDGYLIRYRECKQCRETYRTYEIKAEEWKQLLDLRYEVADLVQKLKQTLDKC